MIALPSGLRVWLACGHTDMRKGMDGLAMLAQQVLTEDPFSGALFAYRGKRGSLIKLLWFDGQPIGRGGADQEELADLIGRDGNRATRLMQPVGEAWGGVDGIGRGGIPFAGDARGHLGTRSLSMRS